MISRRGTPMESHSDAIRSEVMLQHFGAGRVGDAQEIGGLEGQARAAVRADTRKKRVRWEAKIREENISIC
jgi:hypothetical protein